MQTIQEIENLKNVLNSNEDTSAHYLHPEIKELQNLVLATHARLESGLESRIYIQIKREIDPNNKIENQFFLLKSPTLISLFTDKLSFRQKLNIVSSFKDGTPQKSLERANKYRVEFAHPDGVLLRKKYDYQTPTGRVEIKNLLEALVRAEKEVNEYYSKFISARPSRVT